MGQNPIPRSLIKMDAGGFYLERPDNSRKAYATVPLSFHPTGIGHRFAVGDELQEILPADVLAACIERGEASYDKPKAA